MAVFKYVAMTVTNQNGIKWVTTGSRSWWLLSLRRGSAAACLLGLWVRIPPGAWMSVPCECCVLWGKGLCDGLFPSPEESCRGWMCQWLWSWNTDNKVETPPCCSSPIFNIKILCQCNPPDVNIKTLCQCNPPDVNIKTLCQCNPPDVNIKTEF